MRGDLFVVSAPSGAGKTTILRRVLAETPNLEFSISHTTRKPRGGERDGADYWFVTREEFLATRDAGGFLEWAEVHGNYYGTSRKAVEQARDRGLDIVLDIDVQGAGKLRQQGIDGVFIFIAPPSFAELERRLRGRASDSDEVIRLRLANARREMAEIHLYDHLVVNDDLGEAVTMVRAVVLARRSRGRRSYGGGPAVLDGGCGSDGG
ncbi:MAG: guanylate kinase [Thermodesulfobacteriota bacterium]